jgi:hypothetical protein
MPQMLEGNRESGEVMYWSKNKENKFKKLYRFNSDEDVAKIMKLPYHFVQKKAEELGLEKEEYTKREWTAEELKWINVVYPKAKNEFIANHLGVSKWQVEHVAYRMNLRKDKSFFKDVKPDDDNSIELWTKMYHEGDYKCSLGHFLTYQCLREIFPYQIIKEEVPIGKLWIDILLPHLNIAVEVHGSQHTEFSSFFHSTQADFKKGQENDWQKSEMLESQNISLFVVYHDEKITLNLIRAKLEEII